MCGILAVNLRNGETCDFGSSISSIQHRGPDDQGMFVSNDCKTHLAQVRLSIIDLSEAGHQPMVDASGRYVIIYNGEIYNYEELKEELAKKYSIVSWRSVTDTEVIVEGFAREGLSFLSKLNGIFSLVIYDCYKNFLHVLRDPFGIKPLFYTRQNDGVYFCSELKGLLAIETLNRTIRQQSLSDQLAFMYVPEPYTLYNEFKKVIPGVLFTYIDGRLRSESYLFSHLTEPQKFSCDAEIIEQFSRQFSNAVKRQLMSDVPVSLMLSGGLDSSAVAHEVVSGGGNIDSAYTISFASEDQKYDQQSDDLHYARQVSTQFGLKLNIIEANLDFMSLLPELSTFLEDGISDPAAINTYLICKSARSNGIKVMMNGQGADEFLGGYRRYSAERLINKMPILFRYPSKVLAKLLPNSVPGRFNSLNRRIKRLLALAGQSPEDRLLGMYVWGERKTISDLFVDSSSVNVGDELGVLFRKLNSNNILESMMQVDQHYDLMSLNLAYTDRMSMACGVEARVPFLDFNLVRLMNSIPSQVKMKHGIPKYILKKAMEPYLPREVVYREKAGFGLPLRAWMRKENEMTQYYFNPERINKQGIFNSNALEVLQSKNISGKADNSSVLFSMLNIQIWLESQAL